MSTVSTMAAFAVNRQKARIRQKIPFIQKFCAVQDTYIILISK
jgi:hypothetical protein